LKEEAINSGAYGFGGPNPDLGQISFSFAGNCAVQNGTIKIPNCTQLTKTIRGIYLSVGTAPTGTSIIVDVNINSDSICFLKPTIPDGLTTGYVDEIQKPLWKHGDLLSVDIDQVGSTTSGADLVISIVFLKG